MGERLRYRCAQPPPRAKSWFRQHSAIGTCMYPILISFVAAIGGFLFGYDLVVSREPSFTSKTISNSTNLAWDLRLPALSAA